MSNVAGSGPSLFDLMGTSAAIKQIYRHIEQVARTNFTVIIQGETGTGKELVTRFIHDYSDHTHRPFVAVDCGALPDSIVESELFGYVKGAFTGAEGKRAGLFEMAKGGTLFLDEIGKHFNDRPDEAAAEFAGASYTLKIDTSQK